MATNDLPVGHVLLQLRREPPGDVTLKDTRVSLVVGDNHGKPGVKHENDLGVLQHMANGVEEGQERQQGEGEFGESGPVDPWHTVALENPTRLGGVSGEGEYEVR